VRKGFTTGSCATAAAKAAVYMLFTQSIKETISIITPAGIIYKTQVEDIKMKKESVSCAVRKDSGDDPDITNNILVYAAVKLVEDNKQSVYIVGGEGVGVVTRPGLDRGVGEAAINTVPREMIDTEVKQVLSLFDCVDSVEVTIYVPEGAKIAQKTFNPRLGIEGGISIIGTTGIVEPMSTKAILDTIRVELNQHRLQGKKNVVISPGNYGVEFMKEHYGYDLDKAIKCSNYIGETIDMVKEMGFENMLLTGHIGKLIKLSGGIMNTHSKEADCRMELMAIAAYKSKASFEVIEKILECVSTEEAYAVMLEYHIEDESFRYIMQRIDFYLKKRAGDDLNIQCIVYANKYGLLGKTQGAEDMIKRVME